MDVKEVKKLIDAVKTAELSELIYETGEVKVTIRRGAHAADAATPIAAPVAGAGGGVPTATAPATAATTPAADAVATTEGSAAVPDEGKDAHLVDVTAPIVGTFYEASSPDAEAYVKVGDRVKAGAVLCIIEAMKLMNEIEAETSGTIAEILVRNEEPVEYGQTLFRIDPD